MAQPIVPVACPLVVCDDYVPRDRGKLDLLGAFTGIAPRVYPHVHRRMSVIAQLTGGLGLVHTVVEIRYAASDELTFVSAPRIVSFPSRETLVRLAVSVDDATFERPGVYLVQLLCEHMCIADTRLLLRIPESMDEEDTDEPSE
jgi:hypothetical protein